MIKVLVPDMPTADELLPYLRRIDEARVYSNNGQLVQELQLRLEKMTGAHVTLVTNGTVALELALKAATADTVHESYDGIGFDCLDVIMPALTFCATGLAAQNAGLIPSLKDCGMQDLQMKVPPIPHPTVAAAVPVAAFGIPVELRLWEYYSVPVVVDAAGAFPYQQISKDLNISTCFSLHATKFIGCGEGGFVVSANKAQIEKIRSMAAFGDGGTNAKMSEYHAAVVLASLDALPQKTMRTAWRAKWYQKHLPIETNLHQVYHSDTLLNVLLPIPASEVIPQMLSAGIETKQWYRPYLDEREDFKVPRGAFPVTDHLREHLLGLPFHNFLAEAEVKHVCKTLGKILTEHN